MSDLGLQTLDSVHKQLMIDEQWTERSGRSFRWVGGTLSQRIAVSDGVVDGDLTLFKLTAEVRVVEKVKSSGEEVDLLLADLNRFAVGHCYSHDPERDEIVSTTSLWVHEETAGWRSKIFSSYVITQLALAEAEAPFLAFTLSGRRASWEHPQAGVRQDKDDMLNVLADLLIPDGQLSSRFADRFEFETVAEIFQNNPNAASTGGDEHGIAIETPFGDYTSISVLSANERHRLLGHGLKARLQLPNEIDFPSGARLAGMLNRRERREGTEAPHLGAWCVDKSPTGSLAVTYRFFIPNMCRMKGLIMDTAMCCVNRARWADRVMNGEPSKGNAWQTLAARLGFGSR